MSDDATLAVFDADRYGEGFYIAWVFDGDEGGVLGEEVYTQTDLDKARPESWEHIRATLAAAQTEGVTRQRAQMAHCDCYVWPSMKLARQALRAVRAAIKDRSGVPWPDWAVKAQAAGWKPPKGWKP